MVEKRIYFSGILTKKNATQYIQEVNSLIYMYYLLVYLLLIIEIFILII